MGKFENRLLRSLQLAILLSSSPSLAGVTCPEGIGVQKGAQPAMSVTLPSRQNLILCGFVDKETKVLFRPGEILISEFDVWRLQPGIAPKNISTFGARENYLARPILKKSGLELTEMIPFPSSKSSEKNFAPFRKFEIICRDGECVKGPYVCAVDGKLYNFQKTVKEIESILHKRDIKLLFKRYDEDSTLLAKVFWEALRSKSAKIIFSQLESSGELDGGIAEEVQEYQMHLKDSEALNCQKK